MNSRAWCVLLLVLAVSCGSCSGKNKDESTATTKEPQATIAADSGVEGKLQGQATALDALVDLVVAEAAELPRAEFDPAALAAKLGRNPQAHFEWVRDHTWWAPYRGLLRGSQGVMLDRVGSNLDRAALLGDLLRRSGYSVRLAHAQLPESRARQLLARVRPIPDQRRSRLTQESISAERQHALEAILPKDEMSLQDQVADSKRRTDEAKAIVRSQADQLYTAVRGAAIADGTADQRVTAALQDHWWVERSDEGKWIAMDVLLPNATMGETLVGASHTSEWKADHVAPSIPDTDWHTVRVQVVVERYEGGATNETTVLETVLRPAELLERPILLAHMPKPWPGKLPDPKADPNALGNAAVSVKEWLPFLQIGDDVVAQSGFSDSGDLIRNPLDPNRDIAAAGGGGFMTGFGEALGGGGEAAASSMTAEWIEYEIRVPGEPAQRLRRPVFDLLGPVMRSTKATGFDASTNDRLIERYEALLSTTDIFLQPCEIPEEFLAHLMTKSIVANQAAIHAMSRESDAAKALGMASAIRKRMDIWGPLPSLAFWRSEVGEQPEAWFIDRPNVLNYRVGRPAVNADRVTLKEQIDIASNPIGVRHTSGKSAFEVRLRQGVADTVAEMLALGGDPGKSANTASLFTNADTGIDRGKRLVPGDAAAVRSLGWPEDVAARLIGDLDAGFMAVTLHQPVSINERQRVGWWRVALETGETIGVMDSGFHAEESEYTGLLQHINALKNFLAENADKIASASRLRVLTPGQSLLLRAAVAAERAIEAFNNSRQPF